MAWFILSAACLFGGYKLLVAAARARDRWDEWDRIMQDEYDDGLRERTP